MGLCSIWEDKKTVHWIQFMFWSLYVYTHGKLTKVFNKCFSQTKINETFQEPLQLYTCTRSNSVGQRGLDVLADVHRANVSPSLNTLCYALLNIVILRTV